MNTKQNNNKVRIQVIVFVITAIVLSFFVYSYVNREQPNTQSFSTKAQLTPNEFISLFNNDNSNLAQQYIDEAIEIRGVLDKVTFRDNKYTLFINSDEEGRFILCEMQTDQKELIQDIQKNDVVTVKGIFKGVLLDAILLNCIIINETLWPKRYSYFFS